PEQRTEPPREFFHLDLAPLQLPEQVESLATLPEDPLHRVGVKPLRLAEVPERLKDVRRQDAAEVDDERMSHVLGAGSFVISWAASASCGTPLSNSAR